MINGKEQTEPLRVGHPDLRSLFTLGCTVDVFTHQGVVDAGVSFLLRSFTIQALADRPCEVLEGHRESSS